LDYRLRRGNGREREEKSVHQKQKLHRLLALARIRPGKEAPAILSTSSEQ